jgi:hypothetical protein
MTSTEHRRGGYLISTDRTKLDLHLIHDYLSHRSYWAQERSLATVEKSIAHSLCFGVYAGTQQVGFARVVTDMVVFRSCQHRRNGCVGMSSNFQGIAMNAIPILRVGRR